MAEGTVEPWLRGTLTEVSAVHRAVLHALELAEEDVPRWCGGFSELELTARPFGLPAIAFQIRHIARSLDRLLTYAEGRQLSVEQSAALKSEADEVAIGEPLFGEFAAAIRSSKERVLALREGELDAPRAVGRKRLPTSLGGLLVHVADHTQRHVGQAITTAKVLAGLRG